MKRSVKIVAIGCGGILLLGGVLLAALMWEARPNPPDAALPDLVRGPPVKLVRDLEPAFQRRVRARLKDGMSSAGLEASLRHDGFHIEHDQKDRLEIASLTQNQFICSETWIVYWSPDEQGRAQKIGAHVNYVCL